MIKFVLDVIDVLGATSRVLSEAFVLLCIVYILVTAPVVIKVSIVVGLFVLACISFKMTFGGRR